MQSQLLSTNFACRFSECTCSRLCMQVDELYVLLKLARDENCRNALCELCLTVFRSRSLNLTIVLNFLLGFLPGSGEKLRAPNPAVAERNRSHCSETFASDSAG